MTGLFPIIRRARRPMVEAQPGTQSSFNIMRPMATAEAMQPASAKPEASEADSAEVRPLAGFPINLGFPAVEPNPPAPVEVKPVQPVQPDANPQQPSDPSGQEAKPKGQGVQSERKRRGSQNRSSVSR